MKARIVVLAAAAALAGFTASACQLSAADMETYRRAVSPTLPFQERSSAFEKVIQACPEDPRLYTEFASLLVANREFSSALSWAEKGLKLAPEDPTLNLRRGE